MNRRLFSIKVDENYIHGIMNIPDIKTEYPCIVFLHGMGGYRTGPHDLPKKTSSELAELGFPCIRFDFRGKGYSGSPEFLNSVATQREDLGIVTRYVRSELNMEKIILIGICSGAKLALHTAYKGSEDIEGLILLSLPPLRYGEASVDTVYRQMSVGFGGYMRKLLHRNTWSKFVRNDIDYRRIMANITAPLRINRQNKYKPKPRSEAGYFPLFRGPVLMIWGEKDPETGEARKQAEALLDKFNLEYVTHTIKGANHNFYSVDWTGALIGICQKWLCKNF